MANLLIVEDNPALLEGMREFLSLVGHRVRATNCSQAALSAIEADLPELIISDVAMPGMTGPQLLDTVRTGSDGDGIPFLFVSASAEPEVESQLSALDGVSFLRKPFEIEMLHRAVAEALRAHAEQAGVG
jgi:two-component system sensor histidine kinase/response regulator